MSATIDILPIWKKGATAHERLYELAELARKHPQRFEKWAIVYCEVSNEQFVPRVMTGEQTRNFDALAVLQVGIGTIWDRTKT